MKNKEIAFGITNPEIKLYALLDNFFVLNTRWKDRKVVSDSNLKFPGKIKIKIKIKGWGKIFCDLYLLARSFETLFWETF